MLKNLVSKSTTLLLLGVSVNTSTTAAQVSFGAQANWGSDTGLGVGVHTAFDLGGIVNGFETVARYDHFFPAARHGAQTTYRELNADLVYRIDVGKRSVAPYLGAGMNISFLTASVNVLDIDASGSETLNGLNIIGGMMFQVGPIKPFIEGRGRTGGGAQFVASAGVRF